MGKLLSIAISHMKLSCDDPQCFAGISFGQAGFHLCIFLHISGNFDRALEQFVCCDRGVCLYPTLATKTKAWRGWGTRTSHHQEKMNINHAQAHCVTAAKIVLAEKAAFRRG
jgi:hypothetical protein